MSNTPAGDVVYLDHHATTPVDHRVVDKVAEVLGRIPGNPSSKHREGERAKEVVEQARADIADYIGALPGEVIFTSGASESNNIAIQGLLRQADGNDLKRNKIVTSNIEHKSINKTAQRLADHCGFNHEQIPVSGDGVLDLEAAHRLIDGETLLVSVQVVNNELGTIQPIGDITQIARQTGAYVHCDAAQALGRLPIDVDRSGVDLMSLSAHKAYGPKGIGVLYLSGGPDSYPLQSLLFGGGQEDGVRPGTLNVPAIAGFGKACQIIKETLSEERPRLHRLRDRLQDRVLSRVPEGTVLGAQSSRVASTTNIHFPGIEAEAVLARTRQVAASTGSACESGAPEPSHVLQAIGLSREESYECVRFAVGRFTTKEEVDFAAAAIAESVKAVSRVAV